MRSFTARVDSRLLGRFYLLIGDSGGGSPYVSYDPEPTEYGHYEIYAFTTGTETREGKNGAAGIDFNHGAGPDLQLTAVLPIAYAIPASGGTVAGLGNIELAAKYRFLHQQEIGWDVAAFPRLFMPSVSTRVAQKTRLRANVEDDDPVHRCPYTVKI